MNPTQYRIEWTSLTEDWGEPTESYGHADSHGDESGNDDVFVLGSDATTGGFISALSRLYDFRDDRAVETFLRESLQENPFLGDLLMETYDVIREHFGPGTRVALEVVADPEAPSDQELFVVVRSRFRPKIARALLSELDRGWWRGVSPTARRKMELAVE